MSVAFTRSCSILVKIPNTIYYVSEESSLLPESSVVCWVLLWKLKKFLQTLLILLLPQSILFMFIKKLKLWLWLGHNYPYELILCNLKFYFTSEKEIELLGFWIFYVPDFRYQTELKQWRKTLSFLFVNSLLILHSCHIFRREPGSESQLDLNEISHTNWF